jgi:hypothetical protein
MRRSTLCQAAAAALLSAMPLSEALAHCYVGSRFFPATVNVDDPCVADELSLPTVSAFKNGDVPPARQLDISGEFSKRITESFGVSVADTWTRLRPPGGPTANGFQNLETTFKYQAVTDAAHEFVLSAAVSVEWANTGARQVGAEGFSTVTPTLFFGKGFGEFPEQMRWARPFAITGQVGYAIPSRNTTATFGVDPDTGEPIVDTERNPRFVVYGGSLQYSMPYLKANVVDLGLPDFINRLIPIVEAQFQTPVGNDFGTGVGTTGTINPGVIWVGDKFQLAVEAIIPVNRASGSAVGIMGQVHFYLDDIFPNSIGRPIFASNPQGGPAFGR